jgi:hypothetical protein
MKQMIAQQSEKDVTQTKEVLMAHSSVVTGTSGMEDSISYELPGTE